MSLSLVALPTVGFIALMVILRRGTLSDRQGKIATAVLVATVPVAALVLHLQFEPTAGHELPSPAPPHPHLFAASMVSSGAVKKLQDRLDTEPDDGPGWLLLGNTLHTQGDMTAAADAYQRAIEAGIVSADLYARYAEAKAYYDDVMSDEAYALLQQALAIEPEHLRALWLAGSAAYERNDPAGAVVYWRRLEDLLPDNDFARTIRSNLAHLESERPGAQPVESIKESHP